MAISRITPPSIKGSNIWTFSHKEPSEKEEAIEELEEVEGAPKNIFQRIWEAIINFFKRIFRI